MEYSNSFSISTNEIETIITFRQVKPVIDPTANEPKDAVLEDVASIVLNPAFAETFANALLQNIATQKSKIAELENSENC